ncbi:uncharacterized protein N7529_002108 [Penicillium soppii]|uniref:uncharacterized protein n=1 Tax=Penicillium soppii TaxID=69789 RepID=UPI0025488997|nr:uncharacterized protein N7529_002108 [Penicillium soppii]KAJ5876524.1 hypothetical protein N7529_002108 [Penicillium soppii]
MAVLETTIDFVKLALTGLWCACAAVVATSGWTAPGCLVTYFGSAVTIMLSLSVEVYHYKKQKLLPVSARGLVEWPESYNHSYLVGFPQGDTAYCTEYNLSETVPHDVWVNVTYLNTGVSTAVRHNDTSIEMDMAIDDKTPVSLAANVKRTTHETLSRLRVIAEKMEKVTYSGPSAYKHTSAVKDADKMWRLGSVMHMDDVEEDWTFC